MDSTPIHVTCKFARHYGKDCESQVHVNLDFRMPAIIAEMAVAHISRHAGKLKTVYWWNLDLQQEDKKIISLMLFAVVLDHRKSFLPALVPELTWLMSMVMDNISEDFDFQSVTKPKKDIKLLYLKVGR